MKIVQINTVVNNSTGRIMHDIQRMADSIGYSTLSIVGRRSIYDDAPCVKYGNGISFWIHVAITTIFDKQGYGSYFQTKKIVNRLRLEKPDIIHLHNIHGYYIHIPTLFNYLNNEFKGKIVWTLHDLWPITGHCPHYVAVGCDRWRTGCFKCPNKRLYPVSLFIDNSKNNYYKKRELFTKSNEVTLTVPSEWMKEQLGESFLKDYSCQVIHNGIDTQVFDFNRSDIHIDHVYARYNIPSEKRVILAVASLWDKRKGLADILDLSEVLSEEYTIVVVGLSDRQINILPQNVIGLKRTENINELVALYSGANIFINPSLEESFSLVTIEAQACGTPCIVLDTSAVKNLINDNNGIVLHEHNMVDYLRTITEIERRDYLRENVRKEALKYTNDAMLKGYMNLYKEVLEIDE